MAFLRVVHHALVFLFRYIVVDVKGRKGLCSYVILVFQNTQKQVFCSNQVGFENLRLEVRDFQNFLRLLYEGDVACSN